MKERETDNELEETAKGIFETFVHRRDAFTVQMDDGRYFASYDDITIGMYLLGEDETAKYSVLDADDEGWLQRLLWVREMLGRPSYLESSRRGGHLWFFFEEPVIGLCPFHDDNNPSFSINEDENYWNCFAGCDGRSVIDFWMNLHGMEFSEAVKDLAERLSVR